MPSSLTIKRYIHLFPFLFIIIPLAWSWFWHGFHQIHDKSDKIMFCQSDRTRNGSLNYVGSSLIFSSQDSIDQVFCPGDYFGDLNETYVTVKNCYLEMYHKEKLLWSSNVNSPGNPCAFSLQRDGNLVLYQETIILAHPGGRRKIIFAQWESQTSLNPVTTELRIKDKQMQVIQAFKDGSERLFYVDEDHPEFREDMGEPKKIANKFVLKKCKDKDKTILRRNEYIGDLNGTHLILQTNCNLQLLNKDQILWSFAPDFRHGMSCVLDFDHRYQVRISGINNKNDQRILQSDEYYLFDELKETLITFEDAQPMIIKTLGDGTEHTFIGRDQNKGLKLKRNPRKLAEKTLNIVKNDYMAFEMEEMDYIGNLSGLHLILGQKCGLTLGNGTQKLWEMQPYDHEDPFMKCSIQFNSNGLVNFDRGGYNILTRSYEDKEFLTGYQLTLEKNQLIMTRQFTNRPPDIFFAGPTTRGILFPIIAEHSVILNHDDKDDRILPKMGFIGDLNGVYAMFEENSNWVLYNKTQVVWESGTARSKFDREYVLILNRNGSVEITPHWLFERKDPFWSTQNLTIDPLKDVLKTELLVNNDGLWLINTHIDETVKKFRALEDTNSFIHVPNEQEEKFSSPSSNSEDLGN